MKETKYNDKRVLHKAFRMALGKTQSWLANKIYVSPSDISKYETGRPDGELNDRYIERINNALESEFDRQVEDNGKWYRDIINLKIAINVIDICRFNPKEQKKAHKELLMPLFSVKNITPWIYIVKDPAFGEMELFKDGDNSE